MWKMALPVLAENASEEHDYWPGEERLCKPTGLPPDELRTTVRELEAMGLLLCLRFANMRGKRKR
jgi:hypothetical protein